jgi:hypothetical protein
MTGRSPAPDGGRGDFHLGDRLSAFPSPAALPTLPSWANRPADARNNGTILHGQSLGYSATATSPSSIRILRAMRVEPRRRR